MIKGVDRDIATRRGFRCETGLDLCGRRSSELAREPQEIADCGKQGPLKSRSQNSVPIVKKQSFRHRASLASKYFWCLRRSVARA